MALSFDWLQDLTDPYAVLGISIAADEKRILKQYRHVAKRLHPDRYVGADRATQEWVGQVIARVINPAYEQLKHERQRAETIALLRLQVRRLMPAGQLVPTSDVARELMRQPVHSAEIFYEQQVARLAEQQYQSFDHIGPIIQQLRELNLVYLQLKMGDTFLREKRSGLIRQHEVATATPRPAVTTTTTAVAPNPATVTNTYAGRHYDRAQQYMEKGAYNKAIQELKDALRMDAHRSEYHALLSYAYLCNNLPGMAAVHGRQALKFNPDDPLAKQLAKKLNLQSPTHPTSATPTNKTPEKRRLFGLFNR
jgi:DnaJ-domain-containing protein 1